MKRIAVVFALVLALTFPTFAASNSQSPEHLSKKQLAALIATANTAADHNRIAAYFRAESERLLAESDEHAKMGAGFRSNPVTNNDKASRSTVNHCDYLARSLKAKSEKARVLAELHERMAREAR